MTRYERIFCRLSLRETGGNSVVGVLRAETCLLSVQMQTINEFGNKLQLAVPS